MKLAPHERRELKRMAASRTMKAGEVRRAKVILRLAGGQSYRTIMRQEGCGQDFVARWKERFQAERLAGFMPGIVAKLSPRTSSAKKPRFLALLSKRLLTVRLIGAPANWLGIWAFRTAEWLGFGLAPGFSPIESGAAWPTLTPRHLLFGQRSRSQNYALHPLLQSQSNSH